MGRTERIRHTVHKPIPLGVIARLSNPEKRVRRPQEECGPFQPSLRLKGVADSLPGFFSLK